MAIPTKSIAGDPLWHKPPSAISFLSLDPELGAHWISLSEALRKEGSPPAPARPSLFWRAKRVAAGCSLYAVAIVCIGVCFPLALAGAPLRTVAPRAARWLGEGLSDALVRGVLARFRNGFENWLARSGHPEALSEAFTLRATEFKLDKAMELVEHPRFDPMARYRGLFPWSKKWQPCPAHQILRMLSLDKLDLALVTDDRISLERVVRLSRAVSLRQQARELAEAAGLPARPDSGDRATPARFAKAAARGPVQATQTLGCEAKSVEPPAVDGREAGEAKGGQDAEPGVSRRKPLRM